MSNLILLHNAGPIRVIISFAFIVFPMKGLKVLKIIFSSFGDRQDMVNFPTELAIFSKGRFNHHGAAAIFPKFICIESSRGLTFSPNSFDN